MVYLYLSNKNTVTALRRENYVRIEIYA